MKKTFKKLTKEEIQKKIAHQREKQKEYQERAIERQKEKLEKLKNEPKEYKPIKRKVYTEEEIKKKIEHKKEKQKEYQLRAIKRQKEKIKNGEIKPLKRSNKPITKHKTNRTKRIEKAMNEVRKQNDRSLWNKFYASLSSSEKRAIDSKMWMCPTNEKGEYVFDVAHIKGRGSNASLSDKKDNMILLPRPFHQMLDTSVSIFTGKYMSKEEKEYWWNRVISIEQMPS